jgi:NADH-quinone oxidoreductase subunit J
MEFQTFIFYMLAAIMVAGALGVVTARNTVHAALSLVLVFFNAAGIWLLLRAEFLAIALIMVYVGAVMVLFLFVVMMLDINIARLRQGFWHYLPVGGLLGLLMAGEMAFVLGGTYFGRDTLKPPVIPADYSNTRTLGRLLFTDYAFPFELASIVLLVGIIAAVMLTLRSRKDTKYVQPADQVRVRRNDRLRIVSMPAEKEEG